ncbi:MAG: PaaI family thioesterase [Haloglomus sp.]
MDVESMFERMPFNQEVGIEITHAADGYAEGRIDLEDRHSSNPLTRVAHGGVTYALADTLGGAAVISAVEDITPTIDMRIDYLAPGTGEVMEGEAECTRVGESVATVDVVVRDGEGERLATARGTYKTGGDSADSAWDAEEARNRLDEE